MFVSCMRRTSPLLRTFAVGLAVALTSLPAGAQDAGTGDAFVQSIKTPQFESTITVAPQIVTEAGLGADLVSASVGTAKKLAELAAEDAEASPEYFRPYLVDERWDVTHSTETLLSVLGTHWMYTGGAHGNADFSSYIWQRDSTGEGGGDYVQAQALFVDGNNKDAPVWGAFADYLIGQWEAEWTKRSGQPLGAEDGSWRESASRAVVYQPEYQPIVTLLPSTQAEKSAGLTFHYAAYIMGPYAMGPFSLDVPYAVFEEHLTEDASGWFGGEIIPAPLAEE